MDEKMDAVGYVRCSTDQQEDSPEQQKRAIAEFAIRHGYTITEWYVDVGKSGTTFDQRSEFERLRVAVESQPVFRAVICYDESRWGRAIDAEENTFWRVHFRRNGVDVVLVKTSIDPDHEYAPMMKAFEGVQASQFSKKLSELTFRGASSNGIYSSGGTAPYGYQRVAVNIKSGTRRNLAHGEWCVKKQEKVAWVLGDGGEVETVRFIFTERSHGTAYVVIAKKLNDKGVPCARRGKWRNQDRKWSAGTIKSILENPYYFGARVYNRFSSSKIRAQHERWDTKNGVAHPQWRMDRDKWITVENAHEAIVDRELWLEANTKSERRRDIRPKVFVPYLLSGLVFCAKCGFAFQGQSTRSRGKNYFRYICGGYNSKRVCEWAAVGRDELESFVVDAVDDVLGDSTFIDKVQAELIRLLKVEPKAAAPLIENAEKRLGEIEFALSNITKAVEGGAPVAMFSVRIKELFEQKESVLQQRQEATNIIAEVLDIESVSAAIADFSATFRAAFERSSLYERKELIRKAVWKVTVNGDAKTAECYIRRFPVAGFKTEKVLREVEKRATATDYRLPLRNVRVPGTGLEPARPCGH